MATDDQNKTKELEAQRQIQEDLDKISEKVRKGEKISLEDQKLITLEKKKSLEFSLKELEAKVKANQLTKGQADLLKDIATIKEEIGKIKQKGKELDVEELARAEKKLELAKNLSSAIDDAATQGKLLADNIAPISYSFSRAAVASLKAEGNLKGLTKATGAWALQLSKGLHWSKLLFSSLEFIADTTIKTVGALDEIEASFVRTTGASRDFATEAFELRFALSSVGISGQQAVETMGSLYAGMNEFSQLSKTGRNDFNELATMIDHLGGNAAAMGQTFTKVAGMSISETGAAMTRLVGVADALGVPFAQISDDVQAMGPLFAKFGDEALDIFVGLEAAAKATGLSVQDLYGIVSKFDSFEGAAEAAGRLNMVLGGNLIDTYTLLNANEEERITLLQDTLTASGKTWEELSRFEKITLSNTIGASLEEASLLFGSTSVAIERTAAQVALFGELTDEELTEKLRAGTTAMESLRLVMAQVAVAAKPLVDMIGWLADKVQSLNRGMQDFFGPKTGGVLTAIGLLLAGAVVLTLAGLGLSSVFGAIGLGAAGAAASMTAAAAAMTAAAAAMTAAAASIGAAGPALGAAGPAMAPAIPAVLAFGAAIALIGIGIGAAAYGMSFLVEQFKDMNAGEIIGMSVAIGVFAVAVVGLGSAVALAAAPLLMGAPALLAFGIAVALIGSVIGPAAAGIAIFAPNLKDMNAGEIRATAGAILSLAVATGVITVAMSAIALNPFIGRGIRKLGKMLKKVGNQINLLDTEKVQSFAAALSSMAQLATVSLAGTGVPAFISEIVEALDEIPNDTTKMVNLSTTADSLTALMKVSATVEEAQLANIKMIIEGVSKSEGNENVGKLVNTLSSMFGAKDGEQGSAARKIVIELDGNKLGEFIDKRENEKARRYAHFTGRGS